MAGYSGTPLTKKIGAKPGARALVVNGPPDAPELFADGVQVLKRAGGAPLDAIVVFAVERRDLERRLPRLRERLDPAGMLWVAWPKRASGVPTDVTEDVIRDFAVANTDLVDVKVIAVDETWSGLKLMIRREAR
ncbi:MAG: hypothetical protein E6G10_27215 [Actinobacteria bacterium]|nr:MAG: hypothetical protein E6G10_27215 [Actinomycetota bacterium]